MTAAVFEFFCYIIWIIYTTSHYMRIEIDIYMYIHTCSSLLLSLLLASQQAYIITYGSVIGVEF